MLTATTTYVLLLCTTHGTDLPPYTHAASTQHNTTSWTYVSGIITLLLTIFCFFLFLRLVEAVYNYKVQMILKYVTETGVAE